MEISPSEHSFSRFSKAAALLLLIHFLLSLHSAWNLSPTWDEISYPFSGYVHLKKGSLDFYPRNPFLSRIISGVPLFFIEQNPQPSFDSLVRSESAEAGYRFFYEKAKNPLTAIFLSRLPAAMFSTVLAFILYVLARSVWGKSGGLLALVSYSCVPIFLSRASLALLEMPSFVFMGCALGLHLKWLDTGRFRILIGAAVFSGLALLCKFIAFPLIPTFILLNLFSQRPWRNRIQSIGVFLGVTTAIVVGCYLIWSGGWQALRTMVVVADTFSFNKQIPYFWKGRILFEAPSLITWGAFAVKAPLLLMVLFIWSLFEIKKNNQSNRAVVQFLIFFLMTLVEPIFLSQSVSTVQLSPAYLSVVFMIGALGSQMGEGSRLKKVCLVGGLSLTLVDVYSVHPNYLAYFNSLVGGPANGYRWLKDSDQDWGQSLPSVGNYLSKHPMGEVFLCYAGAGRPEAYGITYQDLFSPALTSRFHTDPPLSPLEEHRPVYVVIGTNVLQTNPEIFRWLELNQKPVAFLQGCFFIYEISKDAESFRWLGHVFLALHRVEKAVWSIETAQRLNPGNSEDLKILDQFRSQTTHHLDQSQIPS